MGDRHDNKVPAARRLVVPVALAVTIIGTIAMATSCAEHHSSPVDATAAIDASVDGPFDAATDPPVDTPIA